MRERVKKAVAVKKNRKVLDAVRSSQRALELLAAALPAARGEDRRSLANGVQYIGLALSYVEDASIYTGKVAT